MPLQTFEDPFSIALLVLDASNHGKELILPSSKDATAWPPPKLVTEQSLAAFIYTSLPLLVAEAVPVRIATPCKVSGVPKGCNSFLENEETLKKDLAESLVTLYVCDASGKELTASSDAGRVIVDDPIDVTDHVLQPSRLWIVKIPSPTAILVQYWLIATWQHLAALSCEYEDLDQGDGTALASEP